MLEIRNLSIRINDRFLVRNCSFVLNQNDKLAIIGEEGNGKSSLLKVIAGCFDYGVVEGDIQRHGNRIGYLKQSLSPQEKQQKTFDFLFEDQKDYLQKMNDYYHYGNQFGFEDEWLELPLASLSGGQRIKAALLQLLLQDCDILLLDEPTNDLDLKSLDWLEHFIVSSNLPIIYVSHDEILLEKTANKILHLQQLKRKSQPQHTYCVCSYQEYVQRRLRSIDKQNQLAVNEKRAYEKQQEKLQQIKNKVQHGLRTVSRGDPHTAQLLKKKMKNLKVQQRKLQNQELTEKADVEEEIFFAFEKVNIPSGKVILDFYLDQLKVNDHMLSSSISLVVKGPTHICIVGENGVGKTTLLKEIYQQLALREDLRLGYMSQDYDELLKGYKKVTDYVACSGKKEDITKARMYLGNMKFTSDESDGDIDTLSNGSKAKLILTKLVLEQCNVLLLDEPTRNVSPLSNPVIRQVLREFEGTMIAVSHDRKFIQEVIDQVYLLDAQGLNPIDKSF